jgi:hypothetical protein
MCPIHKNNISEENYEVKDVEDLQIILTHFHTQKGPIVFLATPADVTPQISTLVSNLLDLSLPPGFFEHRISEHNLTLGNYAFEIKSQWARGNVESMMLTAVLKTPPHNFNSIQEYMLKIVQKFQTTPELYKAFYVNDNRKDPQIRDMHYVLTTTLSESKGFLENYLNSIQMGKILVIGNQYAGKQTFIENLSQDFHQSLDDILKSEHTHTPGKLLIDHFLKQVDFWLYDLDVFDCHMWFEICRDPIAVMIVFDWATPRSELPQFRSSVNEILQQYCFNDFFEPMDNQIPVLLLINETNQESPYVKAEFYDLIKFQEIDLPFGVAFVSIENKRGIDEAFSWIAKSLLF